MASGNVRDKSYDFAVLVVRAAAALHRRKELIVADQFLRAGTSIGANIEEANAAQSKREFVAKMSIASKEARETQYWIRLMGDTGILGRTQADLLLGRCQELVRMPTAIVRTAQSRERRPAKTLTI